LRNNLNQQEEIEISGDANGFKLTNADMTIVELRAEVLRLSLDFADREEKANCEVIK